MIDEKTDNLLPLTHPQKRIWYIEQLYPGTSVHHIGGIAWIKGAVNEDRLRLAVEHVLRRHAALRIRLTMVGDEVYQYIHPPVKPAIPVFDYRHSRHPQQTLERWLETRMRQRFELLSGKLYQLAILYTPGGQCGLFVKIHHLIFDGWSTRLFTQELIRCYEAMSPESAGLTDDEDTTYLDLWGKEQAYLASPRMARDREYWLTACDQPPQLPWRDSPSWRKGGRRTVPLPQALAARALQWVDEHGYSLHELFGMMLQLAMREAFGVTDYIVGVPVYNRTTTAEKSAIGMYTSTMPIRCRLESSETALGQLRQLRRAFKRGYLHQRYPYDLLMPQLRDRLEDGEALFQVCLNTYVFNPHEELETGELRSEELYKGEQLYPLELIVKNWHSGQVQLELDYKLALFTGEQMGRFGATLLALLDRFLTLPDAGVAELTAGLVDDPTGQRSDGLAMHRSVVDAFIAQTAVTPERVAVRDGGIALTYGELRSWSFDLRTQLASAGVRRGELVGLYSEHRLSSVAAIWAILESGAAYVPMDIRHPAGRIADVLTDSGCALVLADRELPDAATGGAAVQVLRIDQWERERIAELAGSPDGRSQADGMTESCPDAKTQPTADDLAYVIYTSGSTGKPKGVMVEHGSLLAYADWAAERYMRDASDVFALYSSPAFDLTVTSVFAPLLRGGSIDIYRQDEGAASVLTEIVAAARATVIKLTPAHLALLAESPTPQTPAPQTPLHTLIVGGEALGAALARSAAEALGGVRVFNEYGPTEATVGCMIHLFDSARDQQHDVPIGEAAPHARLYLLDEQGEPVIEPDRVGELYIAGVGVARGYLGRPELTAERFLPEPGYPGARMYRTGDLARRDERGQLRYLGRSDEQLSLNGYRIEPAEIEQRLQELPGVREAAVVLSASEQGPLRLVACVSGDAELSGELLRQAAAERLPSYMVPTQIAVLETMPLTPSGKLDRRALLAQAAQQRPSGGPTTVRLVAETAVAPVREQALLQAARELLREPGLHAGDDFYRIGGDSIKAIQLSSRLQEAGWLLSPSEVLGAATLGAMAERMTPLERVAVAEPPQQGELPLTPIAAWWLEQRLPEPDYYTQSVLLTVDERVSAAMAEEALTRLVRHHDALRLQATPGGLRYSDDSLGRCLLMSQHELTGLTVEAQDAAITAASIACKQGFSLEAGPLFAACWLELGARGQRLLLTAHHLVVDAVSWLILTEDLERLLEAMLQGRRPELPAKSASYAAWARALRERARTLRDEDVACWLADREEAISAPLVSPPEPAGEPCDVASMDGETATQLALPRTTEPADEPPLATVRDVNTAERYDSRWQPGGVEPKDRELRDREPSSAERWLSPVETVDLLGDANLAYRTEPSELLLTALAIALAHEGWTSNRSRLVIEVERHGREPIVGSLDLTRTVGWFTSLYPLPLELGGADGLPLPEPASQTRQESDSSEERQSAGEDAEWEQAIVHVKRRSRSIPHGGIDYGIARYLSGSVDAQRLISGADAVFNYIGELRPGGAGRLIALAGEYTGPDVHPANASPEGVEALAWISEGRLCLTIRLGAGGATAAERLAERWGAELLRLLGHCLRAETGRFVAADFETVQLSEDELEGLFHD